MAAMVLKRPHVAISSEQSKRLASALANIAKQYKVEFNPAVVAWLQLAGVSTAVYGPMIAVEISARKKSREQKKALETLAGAGTVAPVQMTTAPPPNTQDSGPTTFNFGP